MVNPKLRFKADDGTEYTDWKQYKLGNLGSFKKGKGLSKDQLSEEGTPCILYGQLYTDYNEVIKSVVSKTNASLDNAVFSEGNELLFPCSDVTPNGLARTSYLSVSGVILGGDITICKCNNDINGKFLSYFINSPFGKRKIYCIIQGSTVFHTSASSLAKINVTYPQSLEEQRKIAEFLSTFDSKVEAKEQQLEALQETKKGLLQQIFSQQLRFKADDGTEFPEWRASSIGQEGYFYYGKSAPKWSISDDAKTPCVRYGELYTKHNYQVKQIYSFTSIEPKNLRFSKGGEVLVPRVGEEPLDFCKCAYLPFAGVAIGEMISVYNTENNPLFISYLFNATMRNEFAKKVEGGNVSNLYYSYLENIALSVPCLEEQRKIAEFLGTFDEKIEAVKRQLEALKEIKKGLLQQMFV